MQASKERLASLGAALTPKAGALPKVPRFWKRKGAPGQDTEHPEGAVEGDHATTGASGSEAYYQDSREQGEPYGEHGEDAEVRALSWPELARAVCEQVMRACTCCRARSGWAASTQPAYCACADQ